MTDHRDPERLPEPVLSALRQAGRLDPRFDDRVMAAVRAESRSGPWRAVGLAAVLAGACLVGAAAVGWWGRGAGTGLGPAAATRSRAAPVTFEVAAPEARSVVLVGDFNDWDSSATPLKPAGRGAWAVRVKLPPGNYSYAFIIDGDRWATDPLAPQATSDDYGRPNSLITIPGAL
jgi:AMP-activated protein kinase-like protein